MKETVKRIGWAVGRPLVTIFVAVLIGALLVLPTGTSPLEAYGALLKGAFGSQVSIYNSLERATPLLFTGLAATVAFKAGVFNIGIEGQLYMGAFAAALMGIYGAELPRGILIPLCILAAMAGGLLWAVIPGYLNTKLGINLVVISIMMNNIGKLFTEYLCTYPFKGELPVSATAKLDEAAWMTRFSEKSSFNTFFFLGVLLAIVLYFVIFKTRFGYELRALGLNERFTRYNGIDVKKRVIVVLLLSAAIGGLAGAEQVMGANQRFYAGFSADYGFTGITVALLGGLNPLGVIIGAVFFGALNSGAVQMEVMTNISRDLISTLQAIMIMLLAIEYFGKPWIVRWLEKRKRKTEGGKAHGVS